MEVFKLEFRNSYKSMLTWAVITSLVMFMFMMFFPSMGTAAMSELINAKINAIPASVMAAVGLDNMLDFSDITQYYSYVFQYILLAGAMYACLMGATSLIKEETDGTIEYLYSQPVKRSDIVFNKLMCTIMNFCIFAVIIAISSVISFLFFETDKSNILNQIFNIKQIALSLIFTGVIFISVGFLISTVIKSSKQAMPLSIGFVFLTYMLGIMGKAVEGKVPEASVLKYFSPVYYNMPIDIIKKGFDMKTIIIGSMIICISILMTFVMYNKKDMKI